MKYHQVNNLKEVNRLREIYERELLEYQKEVTTDFKNWNYADTCNALWHRVVQAEQKIFLLENIERLLNEKAEQRAADDRPLQTGRGVAEPACSI